MSTAQPTETPTPRDTETLAKICDLLGIGAAARTEGVILTNIENALRRSDCLSRIEAYHSVTDGEPGDECEVSLLRWGESPDEYIARYKTIAPNATIAAQLEEARRVAVDCIALAETGDHSWGMPETERLSKAKKFLAALTERKEKV
jgi:hypothetical protein